MDDNLRGNNIKTWNTGDPDMDAMDEFFAKNPEALTAIRKNFLEDTSLYGTVIIFGTGGDMKADFRFNELFSAPTTDTETSGIIIKP